MRRWRRPPRRSGNAEDNQTARRTLGAKARSPATATTIDTPQPTHAEDPRKPSSSLRAKEFRQQPHEAARSQGRNRMPPTRARRDSATAQAPSRPGSGARTAEISPAPPAAVSIQAGARDPRTPARAAAPPTSTTSTPLWPVGDGPAEMVTSAAPAANTDAPTGWPRSAGRLAPRVIAGLAPWPAAHRRRRARRPPAGRCRNGATTGRSEPWPRRRTSSTRR